MQSSAPTVSEYLAEQTHDDRATLEILLKVVRENIQPGYDEVMRWGMISFEVPMSISGTTYNKQPLNYVAIARQKHYFSVYLTGIYIDEKNESEFRNRWLASVKTLDMGKACVRFKTLENANLAAIAWAIGLLDPRSYVEFVDRSRS
jgi:hypothetical protein